MLFNVFTGDYRVGSCEVCGFGLLPPEMTISSSSNVSWAIALVVKIEKMAADMNIFILLIDKPPHKLSFLGSNGSKFKLALLLTDKS